MTEPICEICGAPMVIDEWGGWYWTCFSCGAIGRLATYEETDRQQERLQG